MNDKTDEQQDESATADSAEQAAGGDAEETAAPEASQEADAPAGGKASTPAAAQPPAQKSSSGIGILALLIAVAAAAGAGYVWYEQQAQRVLEARIGEVGRDLERRSRELDRVLDSVEDLARIDRENADEIASVVERIDSELAEIPVRMAQLEATVEKVPGISFEARSAWLRSEAEYFLRIANAQLSLADNVGVSLRALELADEQLRDLADPKLTPVREAISDERAALKAVPQPDAEGIVLKLGSLTRSLDKLTLADVARTNFRGEAGEATAESGWQRAWRAIVDALKSVISVKREDREITPLLTAAEESMLLRSLDVDLQIARLAVMRNEGALYRDSLAAVRDRLNRYFDLESTHVQAALSTLDEVAQAELPDELPDISGSLTLLLNIPAGVDVQ
ncbi:MAG: uroporphyrinogen-III C-methyltransferase [Gammaproteobacteria bacterium]|nr:uroporphyrinogen-III C-methyltransferase [Gammaproteobacteria bacterium]